MRYAKEGDRILDTHLGSGSSAIAASNTKHQFVGLEINPTYFDTAIERIKKNIEQLKLF